MGKATRTHINKFWSSWFFLFSTSSTLPSRLPISTATTGDIMLKGASQIYTHKDACSKRTFLDVIPLLHRLSMRSWLSKVQGPLRRTRSISNSEVNLNWNKLVPTSKICTPSFKPHALLNVFFAALLLNGLQVRNCPIKLRLQPSISVSLPSSEISMTSSSSVVNFIFSILSMISSAMVPTRGTSYEINKIRKQTNTQGKT